MNLKHLLCAKHCEEFFFFFPFKIFIWLHWVFIAACGIFSCSMWDLVP